MSQVKITAAEVRYWRETRPIGVLMEQYLYTCRMLLYIIDSGYPKPARNLLNQAKDIFRSWQVDFLKDDTQKDLLSILDRSQRLIKYYVQE